MAGAAELAHAVGAEANLITALSASVGVQASLTAALSQAVITYTIGAAGTPGAYGAAGNTGCGGT